VKIGLTRLQFCRESVVEVDDDAERPEAAIFFGKLLFRKPVWIGTGRIEEDRSYELAELP
jgi:hypothetical protein